MAARGEYKCPYCGSSVPLLVPDASAVAPRKGFWDSFVYRETCKEKHYKQVWSNGIVRILFSVAGLTTKEASNEV